MNKETLINRIRVLRAEKRISQEELGKAVGVTRQTIIAIENNKYVPSATLAAQIARYFGVPFEKAFYFDDSKNSSL